MKNKNINVLTIEQLQAQLEQYTQLREQQIAQTNATTGKMDLLTQQIAMLKSVSAPNKK